MKLISRLIVLMVLIFGFILFLGWKTEVNRIENPIEGISKLENSCIPTSVQMYYYLMEFSEEFNVPTNIAFGVAHHESGYNGLRHWRYNPKLTSSANAYGAMQIQVPTANSFADKKVTRHDLLNNLKLNVYLSMKILSYLKNKYGSWELALGAYNTGRPIVNQYALNISNFDTEKLFK
jgi:soluble lytic murein transglycosylase-like protein